MRRLRPPRLPLVRASCCACCRCRVGNHRGSIVPRQAGLCNGCWIRSATFGGRSTLPLPSADTVRAAARAVSAFLCHTNQDGEGSRSRPKSTRPARRARAPHPHQGHPPRMQRKSLRTCVCLLCAVQRVSPCVCGVWSVRRGGASERCGGCCTRRAVFSRLT